MNNKMITIPYADAIEYGENTSALFKALWELTDLIRLESDLKKHHRAYLHVREDIDEKVKEARQIMTKVAVVLIDKETRGREIRWKKPKLPVNDREKWRNRAVCERKEMQLNKKSAESGCQSLSALFCC